MSDLPGGNQPADDQQQIQQPVTPVSVPKEQKDAFVPSEIARPAEESAEIHEEEVESWLERLERGEDINLPQPVTDDQTGQVLVAPARQTQPAEMVLPVTEAVVKKGLHVKIWDSLRWLAEWSLRIFKMFPGRVVYQKE